MVKIIAAFDADSGSTDFKPEPKKTLVISSVDALAGLGNCTNVGTLGHEPEQVSSELVSKRAPWNFQEFTRRNIISERASRISNRLKRLWLLKIGADIIFKINECREAV
jgi:hypothetical protein